VTCDLTNPIFTNEAKATAHMEADRWPDGVNCPFCGSLNVHKMAGETQAGMFLCNDCREKFTVRTDTIFERSHIPLHKWLLATHLMAASKKGMSALQLSRMLGITYKSAWFMCHRIREAVTPNNVGPIGGTNKVVEADETFIGGKAKKRAYAKKEPKKHAVMTLVDRDGESRSFHVANIKAKTLREKIVTTVSRKSHLMTDELASYEKVGKEFANHDTVHHGSDEYAKLGGFVRQNAVSAL
jgi:transposase-like protein